MESLVTKVVPVIRLAGKEILKLYKDNLLVSKKEDQSPVTEADLKSEHIIQEGLSPFGYPILSEETEDNLNRMKSERVWIVDPLDGTRDFIDKTDEFSVMIGLAEKGLPIAGFVYQPAGDKLYYALKGTGAYLQIGNGPAQKIHVSLTESLPQSILVASRIHFSEAIQKAAKKMNCQIKRVGSNGVKMCMVAEGKADIFFNPTDRMGQWDICAPQIIVEEAGGVVTGIQGERLVYNQKNPKNPFGIAVSNAKLHHRMINILESEND